MSEVTEILSSFRLVLERRGSRKLPESSRSDFPEKISAQNFAISEEHLEKPIFWEAIESISLT